MNRLAFQNLYSRAYCKTLQTNSIKNHAKP